MLIILRMENVILAQRHTIRLALLSLFITTSAFIIFIYAVAPMSINGTSFSKHSF